MYVVTSELERLELPGELAGRGTVLTIGAFDGIHIGHQALIRSLVAQARQHELWAGLMTFDPHPDAILRPQQHELYLTTLDEKIALLETLGLDWVVVLSFTPQLAQMTPHSFMERLRERMRVHTVWVGPDFALGRNRAGNVETLQRLGEQMGFEVRDVPYVAQDGQKVSSTQIRTLLRRGHVAEAACLLGRWYNVSGPVIHGAHRGRSLGFPTANVDVHPERLVPANGVYVTLAWLGETCYPSVTSVGVRPTFDHGERRVETYLLDYRGDLYSRDMGVEFVAHLRPEERFADVQQLIAQMERDVADARRILDARPLPCQVEEG